MRPAGEGRRVQKTMGSVTTNYVYDAQGELAAEYAAQPNPSDCGTLTCFLTVDHLGSTRLVTDQSGNAKKRYDYLPFGEEIFAGVGGRTAAMAYLAAPDPPNPKFTGKLRDNETGLDFFEARYHSAAQGRFTSVDPVIVTPERQRDPQQLNRYSYVGNNPLRYTDPTGEVLVCTGTTEDQGHCVEVLQQIAGDAASHISIDSKTGTVSFDTKDLDVSKNEGALLVSQLVTSSNTYGFALGDTANTAGGPVSMAGNPVSNLDNTTDARYGSGKSPTDLPPKGVNDQVTINPKDANYKDTVGRSVPLSSLAFHELAEAYSKVDEGRPYADFQPLVFTLTTVSIGSPEAGAHNQAVLREFKLRDQRPNLQSAGRAGDTLIRDPH